MKSWIVKITHKGITLHIIVYYFTPGYLGIVPFFVANGQKLPEFEFEISGA